MQTEIGYCLTFLGFLMGIKTVGFFWGHAFRALANWFGPNSVPAADK